AWASASGPFAGLQPPQEFLAPIPQRKTEHAATGHENRLQLSRDQFAFVGHILCSAEELFRCYHDAVGLEPEFLLQLLQRGGGSERLHADDATRLTNVPLPAERRGLLDPDARPHVGRQYAVPVFLGLVVEDVPR